MYDITDPRNAIRVVQSFLLEISYSTDGFPHIAIDGIYGPETQNAVRIFQSRNRLPVTGRVGFEDWNALYDRADPGKQARTQDPVLLPPSLLPLTPRSSGTPVYLLQSLLLSLSPLYSDLSRVRQNGRYDPDTQSAVRAYQEQRRLPPSGIVDLRTWQAIAHDYRHTGAYSPA